MSVRAVNLRANACKRQGPAGGELNNKSIRLAIKALRRYRLEQYGWAAKFHEEDRMIYNELTQAIKELEELLANNRDSHKRTDPSIRKNDTEK